MSTTQFINGGESFRQSGNGQVSSKRKLRSIGQENLGEQALRMLQELIIALKLTIQPIQEMLQRNQYRARNRANECTRGIGEGDGIDLADS